MSPSRGAQLHRQCSRGRPLSCLAAASALAFAGVAALVPAPASASSGLTVWVANSLPVTSTVTSYASPGGDVPPSATLPVGAGLGPTAEAFDPAGNLWVATFEGDTIFEYPAASLGGGTAPEASFKISGGALRNASVDGMGFDPGGNLWVSTYRDPSGRGLGQLLEFAKTASGVASTPSLVIRAGIHHPANLAIDPSGDLWVTNSVSAGAFIVEYKSVGGAVQRRPAVILSQPRGAAVFGFPVGMAFEGGNLWVANKAADQLIELPAASIAASGDPSPSVTINDCSQCSSGPTTYPHSLYAPVSLSFDSAGDLWVANEGAPKSAAPGYSVVEFAPASLMSSGAPAPAVTLTSGIEEPAAVVTSGTATAGAGPQGDQPAPANACLPGTLSITISPGRGHGRPHGHGPREVGHHRHGPGCPSSDGIVALGGLRP